MLSSVFEFIKAENINHVINQFRLQEISLTQSGSDLETKPRSPNTQFSLLTFTTRCFPLSNMRVRKIQKEEVE